MVQQRWQYDELVFHHHRSNGATGAVTGDWFEFKNGGTYNKSAQWRHRLGRLHEYFTSKI